MSLTADRIYALLPAIHRIRDEQVGRPLHALVQLIAREFAALEENIDQLYDDQFIETCAAWVTPYIGDLIGYRPLHGVSADVAAPRADVAHTIQNRRRKGTARMLEQLAQDVTGCPARVVELFESLATTQYMNHTRLRAPATATVRDTEQMLRLGGAFNAVAHTAEMRRPERGGKFNIPNIGVFLWRLRAYPLTTIPLTPDSADTSGRRFRVNPLGADQQLFRRETPEEDVTHIARPINVPESIGLRLMAHAFRTTTSEERGDYGDGRSLSLWEQTGDPAQGLELVDRSRIVICDLRDDGTNWAHETFAASDEHSDKIAIDPRLGRILLGRDVAAELHVTYHSGFSNDIGGGEYVRSISGDGLTAQYSLRTGDPLQPHLDAVANGGRVTLLDSFAYR